MILGWFLHRTPRWAVSCDLDLLCDVRLLKAIRFTGRGRMGWANAADGQKII